MNNYKQFFLIFFTLLNLPIASSYAVENANPTKGFWHDLYNLTGYSFTKNDTVRDLITKTVSSEDYSLENLNTIKKHIKEGANPNVSDSENRTPLYILIETLKNKPEQFEKELKDFIIYGLDVNKPIDNFCTALSYVVQSDYVNPENKLWNYLIKNGADVNKKNSSYCLPLKHAIQCKNIEAIKDLLQGGSRITDINEYHDSAFHYLAAFLPTKNPEIIETILTHVHFSDSKTEAIKALWTIENWTNKPDWANEDIKLHKAIQYQILLKLLQEKDLLHPELHQELVKKGYNEYDFIQKHVEHLLEILTIKSETRKKTAADLLSNNLKSNQSTLKLLQPLFDGTRLRKDLQVLLETEDPLQVSPDNLALKILHNVNYKISTDKKEL